MVNRVEIAISHKVDVSCRVVFINLVNFFFNQYKCFILSERDLNIKYIFMYSLLLVLVIALFYVAMWHCYIINDLQQVRSCKCLIGLSTCRSGGEVTAVCRDSRQVTTYTSKPGQFSRTWVVLPPQKILGQLTLFYFYFFQVWNKLSETKQSLTLYKHQTFKDNVHYPCKQF